jgi:uncharacterized NAD(P)/FAD-binding protein YdhS
MICSAGCFPAFASASNFHLPNCTGSETDPRRALNPLLQSLVGDGIARADSLGLGLAVDQQSRVIAGDGTAHPSLYALGPLTRGSRWEVTAIAEIRDQANGVARQLARAFAARPNRGADLIPIGNYQQSIA